MLKEYLKEKEVAEIMFTWLDEQKAKKFEEEEIRQEGRFEILVNLVKDNILSAKDAAERAEMTETAFRLKAGLPVQH